MVYVYIYIYHLVICYIAIENHHAINRSTIYFNGPFSMAMLNNQRVNDITIPLRLSWLKGAPCQTTPSKPAAVIAAAVSVGRLYDSPQESFRTMKSWPTLNVEKIYLSKYCKTDSSTRIFNFSPPPIIQQGLPRLRPGLEQGKAGGHSHLAA